MKKLIIGIVVLAAIACSNQNLNNQSTVANITSSTINETIESIETIKTINNVEQLKRGVMHAASLWRSDDGSSEDFKTYCKKNYISDEDERELVFGKISNYLEVLYGRYNQITLGLNKTIHEPFGEIHSIDGAFGAYNPSAHLLDDLYKNKTAFYIALNFPFYSLAEKNELGTNWSRKEWAYARLGDMFTERIPAELIQHATAISSESDMYISAYNIYAGNLVTDNNEKLFSEDMVLLSHWNLRDEIKANYSKGEDGLVKQDMIYQVMKRIIDQSIPEDVINSGELDWNPYSNKVYKEGAEVSMTSEPDTRYQKLLDNFNALKAFDEYSPLNTEIKRAFEGTMEISQEEVEKLFIAFLKSPEVKEAGKLIATRLGRDLKPWDIWYDGFKARSGLDEDKLTSLTESKYPNAAAFKEDLPNLLLTLGYTAERANYICDKIVVDPARGSGHAWGAQLKGDVARLRTRIPESGMNYKGYNIAVHEFGHNVEQTISLYDVDYYMLNGVPNTAFTEALAFIFQKRDLELLGYEMEKPDKNLQTLDNFWSSVEIMGVSLLDQRTWKWMYANPNATASELKAAVIDMAIDIWNEFYAPVFGIEDEPILAVYSHMISYPLYLSNYAIGNLIEFQVEQHLEQNHFATEVDHIFKQGRLTPNAWMQEAIGEDISPEAILLQTKKALEKFQ